MSKSSKVDDYWRENNVENLFKELTQLLVRRMPPDPIIAIVEYLQKKFPKSFKTARIQSPNSDIQNDGQMSRRVSNQSGTPIIPSLGSAFTNILKSDENTETIQLAPELNIKNLVFANRLMQQAVKMGKNIRSDHDILNEELIKPIKITSTDNHQPDHLITENLQDIETHDELSVTQLVKYKQQIHTENLRRIHRENLAELAKQQRNKESFFQSTQYDEYHLQNIPEEITTTNDMKLSSKPIAKSKEEEDILNDENLFHPQKQRTREKFKKKLTKTPMQFLHDLQLSTQRVNGNIICKKCGNILVGGVSQLDSTIPPMRSFQPQISAQSTDTTTGTVDDWFEISDRPQSSSSAVDDVIPPPPPISSSSGSSTFRRTLFQPINDIVEHRPPIRPLVPTDDDTPKSKRTLTTPRMSETGIFGRSPDVKIRRSPTSRNTPSPSIKNQPIDLITSPNSQSMKSSNDRQISNSNITEHEPDMFDEN